MHFHSEDPYSTDTVSAHGQAPTANNGVMPEFESVSSRRMKAYGAVAVQRRVRERYASGHHKSVWS